MRFAISTIATQIMLLILTYWFITCCLEIHEVRTRTRVFELFFVVYLPRSIIERYIVTNIILIFVPNIHTYVFIKKKLFLL